MIVIGVDPDSDRHGVAIYLNGKLDALEMMDNVELIEHISAKFSLILVSIENVMANNFIYTRNEKASKAEQSKVGLCVGRCQQAQKELMRWLDHYSVPYVLHKPTRGNWAKNKAQFEAVTGWKGRSNVDTRSAAYFGMLALKAAKRIG